MSKTKVKIGIEYANVCTWVSYLALIKDDDNNKSIKFGVPNFFTTN